MIQKNHTYRLHSGNLNATWYVHRPFLYLTSTPVLPLARAGAKVFSHRQFVGFLLCKPFYCMLGLLIVEAALAALTTWLVIKAGQDLANEDFLIADFAWIVLAQSTSYVVGAISWVYAERAGFGAFGRYMLRFARENRSDTRCLATPPARKSGALPHQRGISYLF